MAGETDGRRTTEVSVGRSDNDLLATIGHGADRSATSTAANGVTAPPAASAASPGRKRTSSRTLTDPSRQPSSFPLPPTTRRSSKPAAFMAYHSGSKSLLRNSHSSHSFTSSSAAPSSPRSRVSPAPSAVSKTSLGQASQTSLRRASAVTIESSSSLSLPKSSTSETSSTSATLRRLSISKGLSGHMSSACVLPSRPTRSTSVPSLRRRTSLAVPSDDKGERESVPHHRERSKSVSFSADRLSGYLPVLPECKRSTSAAASTEVCIANDKPSSAQTHPSSHLRRHSMPTIGSASLRSDSLGSTAERRRSVPNRPSLEEDEVPSVHHISATDNQHQSDTALTRTAPLESLPGGAISKMRLTLTPKRPRRSFVSPLGGAARAWQTARGGTYNSPEGTELASTEGLDAKAQQQNCSRLAAAALAAAVLLLAGTAAAIFLASSPRATSWANQANRFCANSDCAEHVARLSLDPGSGTEACDDFGVFVCSGWRSKRHHLLASSVVSEVVFQWLDSVGGGPSAYGDASENNSASTLLRRPAEFMAACMRIGAQSDAKADLLEFGKFMAALGLPWQTEELSYSTSNYSAPLQALVDLAFRWNLPLWFRLDFIPPDVYHSRKRTLYVTPSPMAELSDRMESLLHASNATYASYLRLFNDTLLNSRDGPKTTPSFIAFLESGAAAKVQRDVFGNLSSVARARQPLPKVNKIRHLTLSLKGVTHNDWVRVLQGSTRSLPSLTDEDSLTLSDRELLKAANTLFVAYSPRDILYHTTWWLLQLMGPLVSDDLFSLIYAHNHGKTVLRTSCAVQLEATYNVLLVAMRESSFDVVERLSVERHLQKVRTVALERLSYAGGLAASTKHSLTSALEKTNTVVWQDQFQFQSSWERLAHMYGNGYNVKDRTFFARWLADRVHFQESLATNERVAMDTTFRLDAGRVTSHSPASQAIAVSMAALRPPFYYTRGTSAMLYGGLGFLYAREIFQMLSSTAELLNRMGGWPRRLGAPPGSGGAAALWESFFSCPYSVDKGALYPELPALHVAYEAYTRFRNSSTDTPLRGLEGYSPEQVFFLTFCHATCEVDSSGLLTSQYCSNAVKNFAPFAVAFSCTSESEMNIDERCEYV
ncbi:membrane metallo-endopeptidase-like 1 isoform X2 [Dermacentor albipictus]|uniref:membrane metallo-endopeptidase-like 1 isoform X2 n=1 Tax=Dermacentor albipictus TaxID=60249 RepID=UPI0038FCC3FA